MRKAAAFYLAVFTLLGGGDCEAHAAASAPPSTSPDVCALDPRTTVSDACTTYAQLDQLNSNIHGYVHSLVQDTDFFSYYRLNLYNKKCPFWNDDNGLCGNRACAVITLENEEDIPEIWRAQELSKLEGPKAEHPGKEEQRKRQKPLQGQLGDQVGESCVVEYDDECDERDYCVPEDESASGKGDYVSLVENPERFTGYSGDGAHQVWEAIYRENCFSKPATAEETAGKTSVSAFSQNQARAALDFKEVVKSHDRQQVAEAGKFEDALEFEDECLEKRVFYRVISGMHASISTHLCYDYLNQQTGEWGPNLTCYKERLHNRPERVSNLYFNFALVSRAVGKLRDYVQDYTFCTGDAMEDQRTKNLISHLAQAIPPGPRIFDESVMFQDHTPDGVGLREDFRNRFRNVSRIMDCVGCDKCRLWGKVQTNGYGTALKVLFEFGKSDYEGQEVPLLRRTELVALLNTLDKISAGLKAIGHFQAMVEAENGGKSAEEVEKTPQPGVGGAEEGSSNLRPNFAELDELDEFGDEDEVDEADEQSLGEIFWEELDLVWKAYKFVLSSWLELPVKVPELVGVEVGRLWDFWLGRPVRPRTFEIRFPSKDEL